MLGNDSYALKQVQMVMPQLCLKCLKSNPLKGPYMGQIGHEASKEMHGKTAEKNTGDP